jgi:tRNA A-37 threonylcarbamoyl transferase component Bud32
MSAASAPVDPNLPQLEVALDPELMRQILQRYLRPLDGGAYQVRECRISYVHHRVARRCLVHYDLRLWDPDTGRERDQLVTGAIYSGNKTRRIWKKVRRSDPVREIPGASPDFAPFSYVPDLGMLVQVFPYDHGLPALPILFAGPPAEMEALLLARFGPGDWRVEAWDAEAVRYRAVQRAALRLTARARDATSGRVKQRRFYAKVYLGGARGANLGGEQTYQALEELWDKTRAEDTGFTVGRPIAYLSGLRTLLQEEAPGTSLRQILNREEEAIPAVRQVARALAALHLDDVVVAQRRRLADEIRRLTRAGKLLTSACPHLGPEIEEIVDAVVSGLEEVSPSPVHGDLKPAHILLDGDRVAFVDFDKFAMADPMLDVANLSFALGAAPPTHTPHDDRSAVVARAFAEEYFASVPESWHTRLPLHYAMAVVRKASGQLRKQLPGWPDKVEALLEEAKDSLSGKVWQ